MRTTVRQYMSFGRPARILLANEVAETAGLREQAPRPEEPSQGVPAPDDEGLSAELEQD